MTRPSRFVRLSVATAVFAALPILATPAAAADRLHRHRVHDRAEDVRDRRENRRDIREDVRDRREDRRDARHVGGARDRVEDRRDRRENVRDRREDRRDWREDRRDLRHSTRGATGRPAPAARAVLQAPKPARIIPIGGRPVRRDAAPMANIARRFAALFIAHAASVVLAAPAGAAGAADAAVIPFTPDRWTLSEGIKVVEHRGVQAIEIPRLPTRPEAVLKGLTFTNGTIEVDVEGTTGLGPSIGFHRRDSTTYELFYVRPQPECATKPDCVQYAPVTKNVLLWDIYPGPQATARYVPGQWNHVKLVVSGRRLRVWVNGGAPALDVTRLEGDAHEGAIVLQGTGFLANVKVTPGAVEGLDPRPGPDSDGEGRPLRPQLDGVAGLDARGGRETRLRDTPSQGRRMDAAAR